MSPVDFETEVGKLAASLYRVDGVQTAFLLGSRAKGKAVKGPDVDLLALFKDEKSLLRGRNEVSKTAAATSLFAQVLARAIEDFWETTERTFRGEMLRDGRAIFLSPPIAAVSDSMVLLAYDPRRLDKGDEMKVRNGFQVLVKKGARWLGTGFLLLGMEDAFAAENILHPMGVDFELIPALMPHVRQSSGDNQGRGKPLRRRTERK
jgi:hypothetical protein